MVRDITSLLNLAIHRLLKHPVKSAALVGHLLDIRQFGAETKGIGMAAVIGQPQFLAISGFKDDGHKCVFLLMVCFVDADGRHRRMNRIKNRSVGMSDPVIESRPAGIDGGLLGDAGLL